MTKHIAVIDGSQVHDVQVGAGMTVADLRQQLRLPGDVFVSTRDAQPFGDSEVLYPVVRDGEKVYVTAPATVAAKEICDA